MTVAQLCKACGFEILCEGGAWDAQVTGGFCGDLLSFVMAHAFAGCAWVTVMGNENTVAVAVLAEAGCIILARDACPDAQMLARASQNGIAVLKSGDPAFETAVAVAGALHK